MANVMSMHHTEWRMEKLKITTIHVEGGYIMQTKLGDKAQQNLHGVVGVGLGQGGRRLQGI